MKTKIVLFLCLAILFVFPTASQDVTPRFSLGLGTPELEPVPYEIVPASAQIKVGAMWRINKWIKSTLQIGYSRYAPGSERNWSSVSPQWELAFLKDSIHQRVIPFVGLARTKHFLNWKSETTGGMPANQLRSKWVQYSLFIGARIALTNRSGCYVNYNRLLSNAYFFALHRPNGNVEVGYYRELRPAAQPQENEKYRRLTLFTSAGFGRCRTIWQDSVYSTENMYDVHLGLELNKGKRLSYFTSLGIRNGVGVTAGLEYSFSLKGSRRLGIRLGVQRKYTREKTLLPSIEEDQGIIFHPSSDAIDTRSEATGKSRGAVIDFNYSLSKNITFYVSYFETRFDFHLPSYGFDLLGNQEDGRYLIQNIQGVTIGFRAYLVKTK
jgi:hypothetical protein